MEPETSQPSMQLKEVLELSKKTNRNMMVLTICVVLATALSIAVLLTADFGKTPIAVSTIDRSKDWKMYRNETRGFEALFPSNWRSPAQSLPNDPEVNKNTVFSIEDPTREAGDTGGSMNPVFLVRTYSKLSEMPLQLFSEEDFDSVKEKVITVANQQISEKDYKTFAVEGAYNMTYQVQLSNAGKIYVLQLSYTLAGCSVIPKDIQGQCENENALLTSNANHVWDKILSTFKFIK